MVEAIQSTSSIECISNVFESEKVVCQRILLNVRADLDETFEIHRKNQDLLFEMRQKEKQIFELFQKFVLFSRFI